MVLPNFTDLRLDGFFKGFIDLVVLHQGRYYVLDYKSNWLGATPAAYRGERLEAAMQQGGYHLQYPALLRRPETLAHLAPILTLTISVTSAACFICSSVAWGLKVVVPDRVMASSRRAPAWR